MVNLTKCKQNYETSLYYQTTLVVRLHTSEHELLKNVRNFMENHEFFVKLVDFMSIYTNYYKI